MESFDYLNPINSADKGVLKNLSQMGEKLKELQLKMLETQTLAEQAKKEYEHYANVIIPQEMFSAGIDSIGLASGGSLKIKRNFSLVKFTQINIEHNFVNSVLMKFMYI